MSRPDECTNAAESGGMSYCIGYEKSCPDDDECCAPTSWYNHEYLSVIGSQGARGLAELKVQKALTLLTPKAIDDYAWDLGVAVPPGLLQSIGQAAGQFAKAFPLSRWTTATRKSQVGCGSYDHPFDTGTAWPDSRVAAVKSLSGVTLDKAFVAKLQKEGVADATMGLDLGNLGLGSQGKPKKGVQLPAALADWFKVAGNAIALVPGNEPGKFVDTQPDISTIFLAENGILKPGPWLNYFLAVFAKGLSVQVGQGTNVRPGSLGAEAAPRSTGGWQAKSGAFPGNQPGAGASSSGGGFLPVLLIGGVLGFFLLRRR